MKNLFISLFLLLSISCYSQDTEHDVKTILIKSSSDSTELHFASVIIFKPNTQVIKGVAEVYGVYVFDDFSNVEFVAFDYVGHYPIIKNKNELELDTVVYLKECNIMMGKGGVVEDKELSRLNRELNKKINNWNKQHGR
jgi:hypothetical protein